MQEMDPVMLDAFMDTAMQHPAWLEAQDMFAQKGLLPDWGTAQGFVATVDGVPVQIFTIETTAQDGTYGVYVFAKDDKGTEQVWKMLTNIGTKSVVGADPLISDLPVYVWSNGMPVYYVYVWHYFNFRWYPYYYLWHDSHNHPNWYYSYYNYWWWWHRWYDYPWAPWFNWFYAWWYWRYFYYWSTWFPY
jgi:hypothetical protein